MDEQIKELYLKGLSAREVREFLKLPISERAIQRRLKKMGASRSRVEAFRLAVKQGKVTYHTNEAKKMRKTVNDALRYGVMKRDGFRCVLCGRNAQETRRLEVDHKDGDTMNNNPQNLQTLCSECNKGKAKYEGMTQYNNGEKIRKLFES